jgi:hypothetical protein
LKVRDAVNDALALEQLRHLVAESSSTVLPGLPSFSQLSIACNLYPASRHAANRTSIALVEPPEVVAQLVELSLLLNDARIILVQMKAAIMLVIKQPLQPLAAAIFALLASRRSSKGTVKACGSLKCWRNAGSRSVARSGRTSITSNHGWVHASGKWLRVSGSGLKCHRLLPHHQM